jgi:hypothetical protein
VLKDTPDQVLRVKVDPGGCSGFQYVFTIESSVDSDDMCDAYTCGPSTGWVGPVMSTLLPTFLFLVISDNKMLGENIHTGFIWLNVSYVLLCGPTGMKGNKLPEVSSIA